MGSTAPSDSPPPAAGGGAPAAEREWSPRNGRTLAVGAPCDPPCGMCLIEAARGGRTPLDWNTYRREVDAAAADPQMDRLILSGADGASEPELLRRAEYARDSGGFRHVRVQSNGRRFADAKFTRAVRQAGVDEFCLAVSGHAETEVSMTGSPEGFAHLLAGLENVRDVGATLITCTAVVERNARDLADITELVLRFRPARVEFYNLVPVLPDQRGLLAPLSVIQPALQDALARLAASTAEAAVIWFPRCTLGPHDDAFAVDLPEPLMDAGSPGPRFQCFYGRACAWYGPCRGLPEAYIERFGWETERLHPREGWFRDRVPSQESARPGALAATRPADSRWLELLSGPDGEPLMRTSLWSLENLSQAGGQVRYRFLLPDGGRYELVLEPRADDTRRHAQTAGFNVTLVPVGSSSRRFIPRLLFTLLPIVSRNDDGRLRLD